MFGWIWRKVNKQKKEYDALKLGIRAQLRDRINQSCQYHLDHKEISNRDREVKSMRCRQRLKPLSKTYYVQHSKKIATWGLIQFAAVVSAIMIILCFTDISSVECDVLTCIVTSSATLSGVAITGYMGNSAAEKYSAQKFSIQNNIISNMDNIEEDSEG